MVLQRDEQKGRLGFSAQVTGPLQMGQLVVMFKCSSTALDFLRLHVALSPSQGCRYKHLLRVSLVSKVLANGCGRCLHDACP
jgi:hypothetical protein